MATPAEQRRISAMVVDPSSVMRGLIGSLLESAPEIRLVATAKNGSHALHLLQRHRVDVLLCDAEIPELDQLLVLCKSLPDKTRVIMLSGPSQQSAEISVLALALGAGDFVYKPLAVSKEAIDALAQDLLPKVRALGRGVLPTPSGGKSRPPPLLRPAPAPGVGAVHLLAFGASTGGPQALTAVLKNLSAVHLPPIVVVQHMPPLFTTSFAAQVRRDTGRPCTEAQEGETLLAGQCYLAPGGYHMTVAREGSRSFLRVDQGPEENFCRPSVDVLFRSVARCYGPTALCVVLTGMGRDGVAGADAVVRAGGRVLCQDQQSSAVWGMPGSIVQAGLCCAILPLSHMASAITAYL